MRGISAAARTLGLSQPQLSRRLRRFEDQMGARLFDRTPNGLMLTPAGERLLPLAAEMKRAADSVRRIQPELASRTRRVVRISLDEVRQQLLMRHVSSLRAAVPQADIEFYSAHMHLDHATRETDIQIRSCMPESDTLVAKRLGETLLQCLLQRRLSKRDCRAAAGSYRLDRSVDRSHLVSGNFSSGCRTMFAIRQSSGSIR